MEKKSVGITMGDPAGIGSEIVVKALSRSIIHEVCRPVVVGDLKMLVQVADQLGLDTAFKRVRKLGKISKETSIVEVLDLQNVDLNRLKIGEVSVEAGKASLEYIKVAVKQALNGKLDAITTAPINKESIRLAGSPYIGHTELIGVMTHTRDPITMFWVQGVRIFFLTRHLSLKKAVDAIQKEKIVATTSRIDSLLRQIGVKKPHIAIAALNPHAGDGGLIGEEEEKEIIPAVNAIREKGINIIGPIPADAIFHQAFSGKYDAVLSLYHDQGHIPAKTVDFHGTVSVTLGLPFVRTSVDHGTAFDIAGKGIADSRSLEKAICVAAEIASKFKIH